MFSYSAILLQIAYASILAAAVERRTVQRRIMIALAATLFAIRASRPPVDIVTLVWMAAILLTCLLLIWRPFARNKAVQFTPEETVLRAAIFDALEPSEARHLMNQGWWVNGTAGETLTEQGKLVESLVFLGSGSARVLVNDHQVAMCQPGDLIGEATALTGTPATATVLLAEPSRVWCIKSATLRDYIAANPEIGSALERSFRSALRTKLVASNQAIARSQSAG